MEAHLQHPHQAVAFDRAKREEDDCLFTGMLGGQWLTVRWFPRCWPFNVEDYFFPPFISWFSEGEQEHFLHSDLCMLTFWGSDIYAFVRWKSDSAALKSVQPWELERMIFEAGDDKVRADRAKLIKVEAHREPYNQRNDPVAWLGVHISCGVEVMVLMPSLILV